VFVTDKKGEPVRGLKQEDFQIFEDGHPVAISNFYSVDDSGKPRTAALLPPPVPGAAKPPGVEEPPPVPEEQRLYLIVYVDNFNIKPFNRNRVFRRIREFLDYNVGRTTASCWSPTTARSRSGCRSPPTRRWSTARSSRSRRRPATNVTARASATRCCATSRTRSRRRR
jgi:hypothetical protein